VAHPSPRPAGYTTRAAAATALVDLLGERNRGTYIEPSTLTVGEFLLDQWLPARQRRGKRPLRASTAETYRHFITGYILPHLDKVRLQQVTPELLEWLYDELAERGARTRKTPDGQPRGLAPKTVRHVHTLLHSAFDYARRRRYLANNPADIADAPAVPRGEPRVWSPQQVRTFLAAIQGDRLEALWVLMAMTGLRRGELLGLPWHAVDLHHGYLVVVQTNILLDGVPTIVPQAKTAASRRQIALDPVTVAALRGHQERQHQERAAWGDAWTESGLVFTLDNGQPLHPGRVTRQFRRLVDRLGLPPLSPHGLRHSHATAGLEAGVDLRVVSARLGHASTAITSDLYQHVLPPMDRDAADRIAGILRGDDGSSVEL
jgi:integrase